MKKGNTGANRDINLPDCSIGDEQYKTFVYRQCFGKHDMPCCYCLRGGVNMTLLKAESYLILSDFVFLDSPTCQYDGRIWS